MLVWGMTANLGGLETLIDSYMKEISKYDVVFDFITTSPKMAIENDVLKCGGKTYYIPNRKECPLAYYKELRRFMRENAHEYEVVWLNDCLFCNIDILKLAKKYGVRKRIIHAHNSENMGSFFQLIRHKINLAFMMRYATDFCACSKKASEWSYTKKILKSNEVRIIKNAIVTKTFAFKQEIRTTMRETMLLKNCVVCGFIGRLDYQKNPEFVIDVFDEFLKIHKDAILLMVGDGSDKLKIMKKAQEKNIEKKIQFLGIRNDVPELLQAMDILLMPSRFEGFGIVAVEAQTAGLLTVVSNAFPTEIFLTNNILPLSLSQSAKLWAETIDEKSQSFKRIDCSAIVENAGYEIQSATMELFDYFKM